MNTSCTLNVAGRLLSLEKPIVMGIINVSPDSFYTRGKYEGLERILAESDKMCNDGATIIDIGGMSTRPGASEIGLQEEVDRVVPVIEAIRRQHKDVVLSIDTYRSKVAEYAVEAGATMINDISAATTDAAIIDIAVRNNIPYVAMHMQGRPSTMQLNPVYENVVEDVLSFFAERARFFHSRSLYDWILDLGFGFGKTLAHNYSLMKHLQDFGVLGRPLLIGVSRKSMLCKLLDITPDESLNATTALHMSALHGGARILRVHDVKEAMECIQVFNALMESE